MNYSRVITAGLIGGLLIDAFLIIVHAAPFPGIYQFIASTVVGPVAFTSSSYIGLGLVMHFAISIAFALGYAFVAERFAAVRANPILWGAIFGVFVMIVMQVVLAAAHSSTPPSLIGLMIGLISHVVFFGIPVAIYIARGQARRPLAV